MLCVKEEGGGDLFFLLVKKMRLSPPPLPQQFFLRVINMYARTEEDVVVAVATADPSTAECWVAMPEMMFAWVRRLVLSQLCRVTGWCWRLAAVVLLPVLVVVLHRPVLIPKVVTQPLLRGADAPWSGWDAHTPEALWYLPLRMARPVRLFEVSSFNRLGGNQDWGAYPSVDAGPNATWTVMAHRGGSPGCVHFAVIVDEMQYKPEWEHVIEIDGRVSWRAPVRALRSNMSVWNAPPFVPPRKQLGGRLIARPLCYKASFRWSMVPPSSFKAADIARATVCMRDAKMPCPFRTYYSFSGIELAPGAAAGAVTPFNATERPPPGADALHTVALGVSPLHQSPTHRRLAAENRIIVVTSTARLALEDAEPPRADGVSHHSSYYSSGGGEEVVSVRLRNNNTGSPRPGGRQRTGTGSGGAVATALRVRVTVGGCDAAHLDVWRALELTLCFDEDGGPVGDGGDPCTVRGVHFATMFGGWFGEKLTPGALVGRTADGTGYLYWPMPFMRSVRVLARYRPPPFGFADATLLPAHVVVSAELEYAHGGDVGQVERDPRLRAHPAPVALVDEREVGYFSVQEILRRKAPVGSYIPWLDVPHGTWGRVVGVRMALRAGPKWIGGTQEGDFMFYIDRQRTPVLRGTGFEDFFGSAHTFTPEPSTHPDLIPRGFGHALVGAPVHGSTKGTGLHFNAYRFMVAESAPFSDGFLGLLEDHSHGNRANTASCDTVAGVAFFYAGRRRSLAGPAVAAPAVTRDPAAAAVVPRSRLGSGGAPLARRSVRDLPRARKAGKVQAAPSEETVLAQLRATVTRESNEMLVSGRLHTVRRVLVVGVPELEEAAGYRPAPGARTFLVASDSHWRWAGAFEQFDAAAVDEAICGRNWDAPAHIPRVGSNHATVVAEPALDAMDNDALASDRNCSTFAFDSPCGSIGCVLYRAFDSAQGNMAADVFANGVLQGRWVRAESNAHFRLGEDTFLLDPAVTACASSGIIANRVDLHICPVRNWSEIEWTVRCWHDDE